MSVAVRQPAEDIPPVGHDGYEPRDRAAWLQILRDESAPAVLVLVLVEIVLAVAAIPVCLRKRCRIQFLVVRHECTTVPVPADPVLDEFELRLHKHERVLLRPTASLRLRRQRYALDVLRYPPEKDAATGLLPSSEPDLDLQRLPSSSGIGPFARVLVLTEKREKRLRAPDLEQVLEAAPFRLAHVLVPTVADVSAKKTGSLLKRQPVDDLPEAGHAADSRVALPRQDVHAERDADRSDEVRMEVVARASRLLRIVTEFRAFLVPEDRLYGIVDVDDILVGQQFVEDILLVPCEPRVQLAAVRSLERAPHAVLADDPSETEQRREHRVVPQPVDVHVPREAADDREHGRADDVADIGSIRTRVVKSGYARSF